MNDLLNVFGACHIFHHQLLFWLNASVSVMLSAGFSLPRLAHVSVWKKWVWMRPLTSVRVSDLPVNGRGQRWARTRADALKAAALFFLSSMRKCRRFQFPRHLSCRSKATKNPKTKQVAMCTHQKPHYCFHPKHWRKHICHHILILVIVAPYIQKYSGVLFDSDNRRAEIPSQRFMCLVNPTDWHLLANRGLPEGCSSYLSYSWGKIVRYVEVEFERHKKKRGKKKVTFRCFPTPGGIYFTHPMFGQDKNVSDWKETIPINNHVNVRNN